MIAPLGLWLLQTAEVTAPSVSTLVEKYGLPTGFAIAIGTAMWRLLSTMINKFEENQKSSDRRLDAITERLEGLSLRLSDVIDRNTVALSEVKTLFHMLMAQHQQQQQQRRNPSR